MKCFILLAAVVAICLVQASAAENFDAEWAKFKVDYKREYDAEEDAARKEIFVATVKKINAHNKLYDAGKESYSQKVNHFADRKPEELKHTTGFVAPDSAN